MLVWNLEGESVHCRHTNKQDEVGEIHNSGVSQTDRQMLHHTKYSHLLLIQPGVYLENMNDLRYRVAQFWGVSQINCLWFANHTLV